MAFNLDSFDFKKWQVSPTALGLFPYDTANKCNCLPLAITDASIDLAVDASFNLQTHDTLRHLTGKRIGTHIVPAHSLQDALNYYYKKEIAPLTVHEETISFQSTPDTSKDIATQFSSLIHQAIQLKASDIHIEPTPKTLNIRYRIDGKLIPQDSLPISIHPFLISHIKLQAELNIDQKRLPQDGRISWVENENAYDLRLSIIPSEYGETLAIRLLDHESLNRNFKELGLSTSQEQDLTQLVNQPNGLILVTGPTGSGKSTTLYSILNFLKNRSALKIITVEDPIEYKIEGINQVPINSKQGSTFASALRSILRQSPDVIMIGEIRDQETAQIATQAALTGHLVISTLHTNDARSAVNRLFDLGIKPSLLTPALRGVIAQRLVRCLCPHCKESYNPHNNELTWASIPLDNPAKVQFNQGHGCEHCNNTGYHNRIGLFEFLQFPESNKSTTLHQDGIRKIISGQTSFNEVAAATLLSL